jgi:hypothetical protein
VVLAVCLASVMGGLHACAALEPVEVEATRTSRQAPPRVAITP